MAIRSSDSSEALTAANDAATLLRLAADALDMVRHRVHGDTYTQTDELFREISDLYRRTEALEQQVSDYVTARDRPR
jgi:hypothetical protein